MDRRAEGGEKETVITPAQYFAGKPHSDVHELDADDLLTRVNALLDEYVLQGGRRERCPNTGSEISGSKGGSGDGGFRLPTATTGRALSSHKEAKGVDKYDPQDALDKWLDKFEDGKGGNSKLEEYGLYREHPNSTKGWCHLQTRPPKSGHRTYWP